MKRKPLSLYASSCAGEVRRRYIDLLKEGKASGEAVDILMDASVSERADPQYSKLFWLALADTMWQYGRLTEQIRTNALSVIADSRQSLASLQESCPHIYATRISLLDELEEKFRTPQPEFRKVQTHIRFKTSWETGDVLAYRLSAQADEFAGKVVCVHVVRSQRYGSGHVVPVVRVFHQVFEDIPSLEELRGLPYLPQFWGPSAYDRRLDASSPHTVRMHDILYNMLLGAANLQEYRMFQPLGSLPLEGLELERTADANESTCRLFEVETVSSLRKWKDADVYALLKGN